MLSIKQLFIIAALLRLVLLVYGLWQDHHFVVKYTDIDYKVFTDAAWYTWRGQSPYLRSTYRYTPLLAWLLVPNIAVHPAFGKVLFIAADLVVGYLVVRVTNATVLGKREGVDDLADQATIAKERKNSSTRSLWFIYPARWIPSPLLPVVLIWLWNPVVANISTRGNAESLMGCLVLSTLYALCRGYYRTAAMLYGLSVHFKIYPIIYAVPLMLAMRNYPEFIRPKSQRGTSAPWWKINRYQIEFALYSGCTFLALNAIMYKLYGYEFLYETYLYHLVRKDHRHNFSIWFYPIYLTYNQPAGTLSALLAFVPQLGISLGLGILYADDIFFACFAQTFAFVAYNKVVTAQYFMWYFSLLPLVLPETSLKLRWRGLCMLLAWVVSQGAWLRYAYLLEFLGESTFSSLWIAGAAFFLVNNWILVQIINHYRPCHTLRVFSKSFGMTREKSQ
ncbi:GPI mannosyltransferase 1 [Dispira parvispora]|uniref:GPI mannosyltransferase 1 n=1 Tax=Dispira parvispora TaxID=1520584 RepID=A0A9W8AWM2_9FUNG|nr:GPI mannosyltransferase 1 [Dispira parvispora]